MTIGERIKEQRELKKWSQSELAELIGVTQDSISLWEKDKRVPNTPYVILLCQKFGITTDYLLGYENDFGIKLNETPTQHYTQDEQQLIEAYRAMSSGKKKALFNMLDIDVKQILKKPGIKNE